MRDRLRTRYREGVRHLRRVERREIRDLRAWLEQTTTLLHLSVLVFLPLLLGLVTYLSNLVPSLSFLLFPPLASGSYTLFSDPHGKYASPLRFVVGLTAGALCGWAALTVSAQAGFPAAQGAFDVSVPGAALAMFLAAVVTWVVHVEEPAAFSTALLGLLVPRGREPAFVASVLVSTVIVAGVFLVWREEFYEERSSILYHSTSADDRVLVPIRGDHAEATVMLGARLAAAHDAGKVVLLDVVENEAVAEAERELLTERDAVEVATSAASEADDVPTGHLDVDAGEQVSVADAVQTLEDRATEVEERLGVTCEVVVAADGSDRAGTVVDVATASGCDLIAVPYADRLGDLDPYVRDLFASELDVLVHRSATGQTDWWDVMVPVNRAGQVAHSMIDFGLRLAGASGSVSVCHCMEGSENFHRAEELLSALVEPFDGPIETRVSRSEILPFLSDHEDEYDIVFVGASQDRSRASRIVAPPTFQRLQALDADVAIVDRGG